MPNTVGHTPFVIVISYIFCSIMIFWFGPIKWPMTNELELFFFLSLAIFAICAGYWLAVTKKPRYRPSIRLVKFFKLGVFMTLALQIPLVLTYTDKYPWDVFSAAMSQRETYEQMLEQIANQSGTRFYVPLFRSLSMPFFYASLTYGVLNFKALSKKNKILFFLLILCPIDLSVLRGTDKEIFDLMIILLGLVTVNFARNSRLANTSERQANNASRSKFIKLILTAISMAIGLFLVFTYRKSERLDGIDEFCMEGICSDRSGFIMSLLPDFVGFGLSMLTFYLTNGYYGLSLVLQQPFKFTYGIGHSSALLSLSARFTNDPLMEATGISAVATSGWDYHYYWFTIFPWIANDVGFSGSLLVIAWIGYLFRQAWVDAVFSKNDTAAIVFVLLCLLFFYLPANNQITQTFDLYFTFIVAMLVWKWPRKYKNIDR